MYPSPTTKIDRAAGPSCPTSREMGLADASSKYAGVRALFAAATQRLETDPLPDYFVGQLPLRRFSGDSDVAAADAFLASEHFRPARCGRPSVAREMMTC